MGSSDFFSGICNLRWVVERMAFLSEGIRSHGVYDQVCWPVLRILILVVRMLQDGALLAKEHFLTNG